MVVERYSESGGTIHGCDIFAAGVHRGKIYTPRDLDDMVANFERFSMGKKPWLEVPAVLGHEENQAFLDRSDLPAAAWCSRLYRVGNKLKADFKDVPPKVVRLLKAERYKKISAEVYDDPPDSVPGNGKGKMLRRVAFLGGDIPQVKSLDDIPMPEAMSEQWRPSMLRFVKVRKTPLPDVFEVFAEVVIQSPGSRMQSDTAGHKAEHSNLLRRKEVGNYEMQRKQCQRFAVKYNLTHVLKPRLGNGRATCFAETCGGLPGKGRRPARPMDDEMANSNGQPEGDDSQQDMGDKIDDDLREQLRQLGFADPITDSFTQEQAAEIVRVIGGKSDSDAGDDADVDIDDDEDAGSAPPGRLNLQKEMNFVRKYCERHARDLAIGGTAPESVQLAYLHEFKTKRTPAKKFLGLARR